MICKPRQHIDGVFCGDGGHKVEEDHAEQGEDQVQFPPNPKKMLVGENYFVFIIKVELSHLSASGPRMKAPQRKPNIRMDMVACSK